MQGRCLNFSNNFLLKNMRINYIIAVLFFANWNNFAFGQQEKEAHRAVSNSFERNYNTDNYDAVFSSFSSEMQSALPIDKTYEFLSALKQQAGKIIKREFVKYEQSYASYGTDFENAIFAINISIDSNSKINGLLVKPFIEAIPSTLDRNKTKLILPFNEEWTVVWGGDTKELNYHVVSVAQKNAFDLVVTNENGSSFKTDGKANGDYFAFGKEIISTCSGEIVLMVDGVKDNTPGTMNPDYLTGNTVILKTENNEYLLFAHFKKHSIVVKEGQKVKQGQLLGLCGNSGNSSEPHLHFHIQNVEDMNLATGVKCYFDKINVNGQTKLDYSPIQNEKVKNAEK